MTTTVTILIASGVLLTFHVILLAIEQAKGRRVLLSGARSALDRGLAKLHFVFTSLRQWFVHMVVKMTWHKTVYSLLRSFAMLLKSVYRVVESKMHLNQKHITNLRQTTRRSGKFKEIHEHKQAVSLSEEEKKRLRRTTLEK